MQNRLRRYQRIIKKAMVLTLSGFVLLYVLFAGLLLTNLQHLMLDGYAIFCLIVIGLPVACGCFFALAQIYPDRLMNKIAAEIIAFDDPQATGVALDLLRNNFRNKAEIEGALTRWLPQWTPDTPALLTTMQRAKLYRLLLTSNEPLLYAALKAVEQVGTPEALPYLVKLGNGGGKVFNYHIQDDARACHKILEERFRMAAQTPRNLVLLRASEAPATAHEELVRPATATGEAPAEQLLRVSAGVETPR